MVEEHAPERAKKKNDGRKVEEAVIGRSHDCVSSRRVLTTRRAAALPYAPRALKVYQYADILRLPR